MNMPWNLARQTAREAAKPLEAVEAALPEALGLALASGVRALASQPTCDTSAMDGYAVAGAGPWTVVGRVAAGDPVPGVRLRAGEAFGVATGAPVPGGADSVVPVELCSVEGGLLREAAGSSRHHAAVLRPGKHVRRRGEDWSAGDELVPAGSAVSPAVLGLAAGAGHDTLLVHRRPRVALVVTGDELLHAGPPRPGRVRDAIGPMLPGLLGNAELLGTTHLRDDPAALADALAFGPTRPGRLSNADLLGTLPDDAPALTDALAFGPTRPGPFSNADLLGTLPNDAPALTFGPTRPGQMLPGLLTNADLLGTRLRGDPSTRAATPASGHADVLVTCGATSVGPADHLRRVLRDLDADILVSGVACRPGHPMLLAVLPDGRCVVGLPGNPFAALAAVLTLLRPLLDTLGGHAVRPPVTASLTIDAHPRDTRLVPVTGAGVPVGHDRPGSLRGAALADALAVVPPGRQGGEVELLPL